MRALLLAIVDALQKGQTAVPGDHISIVPSIVYVPSTVKTPAVCLKDGQVKRVRKAGGVVELTMTVLIVSWVQITDVPGSSVMGQYTEDDVLVTEGVLELSDIMRTVLEDNLLGMAGMQDATCIVERESEMMGVSTTTLQRKIIEMQYTRETSCTC